MRRIRKTPSIYSTLSVPFDVPESWGEWMVDTKGECKNSSWCQHSCSGCLFSKGKVRAKLYKKLFPGTYNKLTVCVSKEKELKQLKDNVAEAKRALSDYLKNRKEV